jgi:type IV fimbrial biogenesis protein FimT
MSWVSAQRSRTSGFTLIELMVVVLIIAIMLAYGIPSYKSVITQNRMSGEINDLASDIELARSAAIKQGMPVTICPSANPTATTPACSGTSSWNSGWIVFTDIASNQIYSVASGDILIRVHGPLQGSDTLTSTTGTTTTGPFAGTLPSMTFNRMGGTTFVVGTPTLGFAALSLHDAGNTLAWRQCVVVSKVGTSVVKMQQINPGVCP